jgi:hypothetical protein
MNDIVTSILTSIGGTAVVVGSVAAWIGKLYADRASARLTATLRLSATIDLDLRNHRLTAYKSLWLETSLLPKRPRASDVTYEALRNFRDRLRQWYFETGGIFLSTSAQKLGFVPLQDVLCAALQDAPDGPISDELYNRVQEHCSRLRSLLASDIQSRKEGPLAGGNPTGQQGGDESPLGISNLPR